MTKDPHTSEQIDKAKRRADVASAFIGFLIGLALQETVGPVRSAIRAYGFGLASVGLFAIFFMTCMRFFIGCVLHLTNKRLLEKSGVIWFIDLLVITFECTILIFMAGLSTVEASSRARHGFFALLVALFVVDILWAIYLLILWFFNRETPNWKFKDVPWQWAVVNTALIVCIISLSYVQWGSYQDSSIGLLVLFNSVAFVADIWLVDKAELF